MGIKDMIVRLARITAVVSLMAVCGGCTRNNGDIGNWFGTWQLLEITADGTPDADYGKNIFWKFQNDVVSMVRVSTAEGANTRDQVWGTWAEAADDTLLLDFTHADDQYPVDKGEAGIGKYVPFAETYLPYGEISALSIVKRNGDGLWLKYVGADGSAYGYYLRKQ